MLEDPGLGHRVETAPVGRHLGDRDLGAACRQAAVLRDEGGHPLRRVGPLELERQPVQPLERRVDLPGGHPLQLGLAEERDVHLDRRAG